MVRSSHFSSLRHQSRVAASDYLVWLHHKKLRHLHIWRHSVTLFPRSQSSRKLGTTRIQQCIREKISRQHIQEDVESVLKQIPSVEAKNPTNCLWQDPPFFLRRVPSSVHHEVWQFGSTSLKSRVLRDFQMTYFGTSRGRNQPWVSHLGRQTKGTSVLWLANLLNTSSVVTFAGR